MQVGVKIWLLGHLGGEDSPRGRQGASKGQPATTVCSAQTRFGQKIAIFTSVLGSHFGTFYVYFLGVSFLSRFLFDFGADLDPIWGPKTKQEEPQEEPKSSQDEVAVENAA